MTDTKTDNKTKYPSAVYAAAGVGDFVYEQLRKLQTKAIAFGTEAGTQAPEWKKKVAEFGTKVDANKVRESVVTGTQFAAEKATEVYETLVVRGEKAFAAQDTATKPAQAKTDSTPKADSTAKAGQSADAAAPVAKKAAPRKKTA
jgi:heparin binding hemagglutinin HbhA